MEFIWGKIYTARVKKIKGLVETAKKMKQKKAVIRLLDKLSVEFMWEIMVERFITSAGSTGRNMIN